MKFQSGKNAFPEPSFTIITLSIINSKIQVIKFVISDYNWLDSNLDKCWFNEFTSDYIIYDKFHRFEESNNLIRQKNVGQNVYDLFDFIIIIVNSCIYPLLKSESMYPDYLRFYFNNLFIEKLYHLVINIGRIDLV